MFDYISKKQATLRYFSCFLAFGFGTGLLRVGPGTLATLFIGVPLHRLLSSLPALYYLITIFLSIIIGIFVCSIAEEVLAKPDDPAIVWDEICGYLVTMIYIPSGFLWSLLGFVLFRVFDIWKPWPINVLEKNVKGGLGIMLDDILAAFYAKIAICFLIAIL